MDFPTVDFSKIKTYSIKDRKNKVSLNNFAIPTSKGIGFSEFLSSLPNILGGQDFNEFLNACVKAFKNKKPIIILMGAHPIKCGLSPIIINLMNKGLINGLATNGAGAIHDFEIAFNQETSEDVQQGLNNGTFGMVEETGRMMNSFIEKGVKSGLGAGEAIGRGIFEGNFQNKSLSILNNGYINKIPITVHIAIGTDIIHQHPTANGAILGEATYLDFKKFVSMVCQLEGGVVLNIGSAVIMPEIFLKALTIARNLGYKVDNFTTATFDMNKQYRSLENVVKRPTNKGGKGFYFIGQHELLVPLWASAFIEKI